MSDNTKEDGIKESPKSSRVTVIRDDPSGESYKKWTQVAWACAALAIAVAVSWVVILLTTRLSSSTDTVSQLSDAQAELISQNAELQTQLETLQIEAETASQKSACFNAFTNEITQATADFSTVALGDMLVDTLRLVLADDPSYTGEVPTIEEVLDSLEAVDAAKDRLNAAIDARTEWITNGSQLPCPIEGI